MDKRERLRLDLAGDIAKLLKFRSFRDLLPPLSPSGAIPFVVGLPDDTLHDLIRRAEEMGSNVHLVVLTRLGSPGRARLRVLRLSRAEGKAISDLDERYECAVSDDSTLAMLMEHIEVGEELTYHTYDSETVIGFINDSVQPIPA
jgi:hypothetical protein